MTNFALDLIGLPDQTKCFVERIVELELGLTRCQIHGLFVLIGFYAGTPRTESDMAQVVSMLEKVIPTDRSKNLDEVVGDFYDGYDAALNEFCFRTGFDFEFRNIPFENVKKPISIVYLRDEGLLDPSIRSINKLADSSRLFDHFLEVLGHSTASQDRSLLDSFNCGVFQIQLHAKFDVQGCLQLMDAIQTTLPLLVGQLFRALTNNQIDYFLGLEVGQIALYQLMSTMNRDYAQQMWGFQSHLYFLEGEALTGVNNLDPKSWHEWVLGRANELDERFLERLTPFSESAVQLSGLPSWTSEIGKFELCDTYIDKTWGLGSADLRNQIDILEYKALMVHVIYASLTSSRESQH